MQALLIRLKDKDIFKCYSLKHEDIALSRYLNQPITRELNYKKIFIYVDISIKRYALLSSVMNQFLLEKNTLSGKWH